jgi:hypothetical protein
MHYGMFRHSTADPQEFTGYLDRFGFKGRKLVLEDSNFLLYEKERI